MNTILMTAVLLLSSSVTLAESITAFHAKAHEGEITVANAKSHEEQCQLLMDGLAESLLNTSDHEIEAEFEAEQQLGSSKFFKQPVNDTRRRGFVSLRRNLRKLVER